MRIFKFSTSFLQVMTVSSVQFECKGRVSAAESPPSEVFQR